jgi:glycosyltransferase involved in cell wall biosynthesis
MRVLFVAHLYPWPAVTGNALRVFHLLKGIAARHQVTLVAVKGQGDGGGTIQGGASRDSHVLDPIPMMCERVVLVSDRTVRQNFEQPPSSARAHFLRRARALAFSSLPYAVSMWDCPELVDVLRGLRRTERFDAVWVERAHTAEMVRRAGFDRLVVDLDDIFSVRDWRMLLLTPRSYWRPLLIAELAKEYVYERLLPKRFDRLVVCKEEDRRFFGRDASRVVVVPNGADDHADTYRTAERPGEILFTGMMTYIPNMDAVFYFTRTVLPILKKLYEDVRFVAVGVGGDCSLPTIQNGDDWVAIGTVPDMRPYYETASLVVVPMRLGSGTRIKVLDALARGKAVVSTRVGVEGIDVRPGVDLEIADEPLEIAETCARLLRDPAARERLGTSGRARVRQLYDWDQIAEGAERALSSVTR